MTSHVGDKNRLQNNRPADAMHHECISTHLWLKCITASYDLRLFKVFTLEIIHHQLNQILSWWSWSFNAKSLYRQQQPQVQRLQSIISAPSCSPPWLEARPTCPRKGWWRWPGKSQDQPSPPKQCVFPLPIQGGRRSTGKCRRSPPFSESDHFTEAPELD